MGFSKMDRIPVTCGNLIGFRKIGFYLFAIIVLKQFRIGPVEISFVQNISGYGNFTPKPFQKKNCVRILRSDKGNDILPGGDRNHISGITAETVHTPATPSKKNIGHVLPQVLVGIVQGRQISPYYSPGAWNLDLPLRVPDKPLGMGLMEAGGPAGVVNGNINKNPGLAFMDGVYKFDELLQWRCPRVEFGQGRIDCGKTQRGIRTTKPSHAGVCGGRGMYRKQLDDTASEFAYNEIEFSDQVAKGP